MTGPMSNVSPAALRADAEHLIIEWSDGRVDRFDFTLLRDACPCAPCVVNRRDADKQPAPLLPVLTPAEARPLKLAAVQPVGNYAYAIHFSDGHNSGIYTLEYLRHLGAALHEHAPRV